MKLNVALIVLLSSGILFWFLKQEYRPALVVQKADQFVTFLQNGQLAEAHDLTLKTDAIGKDLESFQENVKRQWRLTNSPNLNKTINYVRSGQTYGNRIRRWISGRTVDTDQISVDYTLQGSVDQSLILFEVRFVRTGENTWKISYFQSHAG